MSPERGSDTQISWLHRIVATITFRHVKATILTESYSNSGLMQALLQLPPSPIGLQAFVPGFALKASNLTAALADGRLRAVQGVARAV